MTLATMDLSKRIENAMKETEWDFGNKILYKMCKDFPEHKTSNQIVAKVWLIGRAYAASVERQKANKMSNDDYYKKFVAVNLKESEIDNKLLSLKGITKITDDNLPTILSLHFDLINILKDVPKNNDKQNRRSFASKYLHFHLPKLFFIYDSIASTALNCYKKIDTGLFDNSTLSKTLQDVSTNENLDKEYAAFFLDCYLLKNHVNKKFNKKFTCRHLDNMLLFYSEDIIKQSKFIEPRKALVSK